ncbi:MAG: hypothetical protein BGO08_05760 [Altererythrobacter sp. 66-12]|nr:MAG: hypothetical protein BGO08_05760 [Altererythrobacter sp. 66-12]
MRGVAAQIGGDAAGGKAKPHSPAVDWAQSVIILIEPPVIASVAKQSRATTQYALDCFATLAMTIQS